MDRTTEGKTARRRKRRKEEWKFSSNKLPRLLSPPPTPPTTAKARNATSGSLKSVQNPTYVSSGPPSPKPPKDLSTTPSPAPASSLVVSIPLKSLSSETVQKITCTQENQTRSSSSEVQAASPTPRGKAVPLPRSCLSRPPVTCIFCDITMPIGTDQGLYLQHLEVPFVMFLITFIIAFPVVYCQS